MTDQRQARTVLLMLAGVFLPITAALMMLDATFPGHALVAVILLLLGLAATSTLIVQARRRS